MKNLAKTRLGCHCVSFISFRYGVNFKQYVSIKHACVWVINLCVHLSAFNHFMSALLFNRAKPAQRAADREAEVFGRCCKEMRLIKDKNGADRTQMRRKRERKAVKALTGNGSLKSSPSPDEMTSDSQD